jgi:molybdopterin molybdotransferase
MNGNTMHLSTKNKAKLTSSYNKKGERAEFLKAYYENGQVTILEGQSSAMLQTYALANSLVYLPLESVEINKNDDVTVITLPILKG